jgi:UDP-glucose 4-epimerase
MQTSYANVLYMAKVLVVGGAGYVGSAACAWLIDHGHDVWILDDLSTGYRELALGRGLTLGQAGDRETVSELLSKERFECAMHFAARSLVSESMKKRDEYFQNNVEQTKVLLETLLDGGVRKFIFSSTCAIFGDPGNQSINEQLPKKPINPYGESKLEAERLLAEFANRRGLQAIALRYFNAAGAEHKTRVGERHFPETHLIPTIIQAAARGQQIPLYGTDYPTPDGTCVRDYVHVSDLAKAHEAAMLRLLAAGKEDSGRFEAFNLGSEDGYSVLEVIRACEKVMGLKLASLDLALLNTHLKPLFLRLGSGR